jgi:hypothetical protein
MGLDFEEKAWNAGFHISPLGISFNAFPVTASIHNSSVSFDELLMAVLLQSCLGGSANMSRVQIITSFCFLFFVSSLQSMDNILRQPPIRATKFTLIFDHLAFSPLRISDNHFGTTLLQSLSMPSTPMASSTDPVYTKKMDTSFPASHGPSTAPLYEHHYPAEPMSRKI